MTKNEEIKKVIFGLQFLKEKLYNGIFSDRLDCIDYAMYAIKELQMYKDNKLCLVPEDVYSRQCCELDAYKEIGTVEECRESREKRSPEKCIIDSCPDHTHYKCPSCGQIELSIYKHGFPRLGRITKYCENCGQALIDEN